MHIHIPYNLYLSYALFICKSNWNQHFTVHFKHLQIYIYTIYIIAYKCIALSHFIVLLNYNPCKNHSLESLSMQKDYFVLWQLFLYVFFYSCYCCSHKPSHLKSYICQMHTMICKFTKCIWCCLQHCIFPMKKKIKKKKEKREKQNACIHFHWKWSSKPMLKSICVKFKALNNPNSSGNSI